MCVPARESLASLRSLELTARRGSLDSLNRVGNGGVQMFDGSLGTSQFVDDRLGLEMTKA
jgi:hypothetical protein